MDPGVCAGVATTSSVLPPRSITSPSFSSRILPLYVDTNCDAAILPWDAGAGELVFTTDSFTVQPIEFPGGNIGSLAVHGTLNDLAMMGARPLALSTGFVLEEGLELDILGRIAAALGSKNAAFYWAILAVGVCVGPALEAAEARPQ